MPLIGVVIGFVAWFLVRYLVAGLYTVDQNERAVKTRFGRAQRIGGRTTLTTRSPSTCARTSASATPTRRCGDPAGRPVLQVAVGEGLQGLDRHADGQHGAATPRTRTPTSSGTMLEAVTKDQLNTGLTGQIRYRVSEQNLYAYLFGVKQPIVHVMGYFVSILRERIANFEAPARAVAARGSQPRRRPASCSGISINDLRKNLRDLNEHMDRRVPVVGRALRHRARCLAHHRHRPAAGGRVGAGRHQHRAQPGLVRHQPGPGGRRPEDRAVAGARWRSRRSRPRPKSSR